MYSTFVKLAYHCTKIRSWIFGRFVGLGGGWIGLGCLFCGLVGWGVVFWMGGSVTVFLRPLFRFSYYKKGRGEKGVEKGLQQVVVFYKTLGFFRTNKNQKNC